jgi:probable F420-dependent oxidoreductase
VANTSGKRAYPDRPNLLDGIATMGAVAAATTTIRFGPSVWIAPLRHPLSSAHQFATLDVLSQGRLDVGVGAGWERGEFEALGVSHADRGAITDECLEILKLAWTEDWIDYRGRWFEIHDVSLDPKPVQKPHPFLWYGGVTPAGARRAARHCDGLYPLFLDADADPARLARLGEEALREGERIGRDLSGFRLGGVVSCRVDEPAERLHEKIRRFADHGCSHMTLFFDCPSGTVAELHEQLERFAAEVLG